MEVLVAVVVVGEDFKEAESVEAVGAPLSGLEASAALNVVRTLFSAAVAIFLTADAMWLI